jgi:hypothetical protein
MERYTDYLIDAKTRGTDDHWEPRYAIYNADGLTEVKAYRVLLTHTKTQADAVQAAIVAAKSYIDNEM